MPAFSGKLLSSDGSAIQQVGGEVRRDGPGFSGSFNVDDDNMGPVVSAGDGLQLDIDDGPHIGISISEVASGEAGANVASFVSSGPPLRDTDQY
jgi:hypothetical protein